MMELNILHLCPTLMSLYGEYANLALLQRRLAAVGVTANIITAECGETPDFSGADMIYMGAGTERSREAARKDLLPHAASLRAAAEGGAVLLFTGSAMPLLGKSLRDADGTERECLAMANFTTEESNKRIGEDVIASSTLWGEVAVGFMNKSSVTRGITTPLFSALPLGFGNEEKGGAEGYVSGNVFATHITGPVLVKNPAFTDLIITRLFERKGWEVPASLPRLPHEQESYEVTARELQARIK